MHSMTREQGELYGTLNAVAHRVVC